MYASKHIYVGTHKLQFLNLKLPAAHHRWNDNSKLATLTLV